MICARCKQPCIIVVEGFCQACADAAYREEINEPATLRKQLERSQTVIRALRVRLRRWIEQWPALVVILDAYDKETNGATKP